MYFCGVRVVRMGLFVNDFQFLWLIFIRFMVGVFGFFVAFRLCVQVCCLILNLLGQARGCINGFRMWKNFFFVGVVVSWGGKGMQRVVIEGFRIFSSFCFIFLQGSFFSLWFFERELGFFVVVSRADNVLSCFLRVWDGFSWVSFLGALRKQLFESFLVEVYFLAGFSL